MWRKRSWVNARKSNCNYVEGLRKTQLGSWHSRKYMNPGPKKYEGLINRLWPLKGLWVHNVRNRIVKYDPTPLCQFKPLCPYNWFLMLEDAPIFQCETWDAYIMACSDTPFEPGVYAPRTLVQNASLSTLLTLVTEIRIVQTGVYKLRTTTELTT
jgi:hypothetical protein